MIHCLSAHGKITGNLQFAHKPKIWTFLTLCPLFLRLELYGKHSSIYLWYGRILKYVYRTFGYPKTVWVIIFWLSPKTFSPLMRKPIYRAFCKLLQMRIIVAHVSLFGRAPCTCHLYNLSRRTSFSWKICNLIWCAFLRLKCIRNVNLQYSCFTCSFDCILLGTLQNLILYGIEAYSNY